MRTTPQGDHTEEPNAQRSFAGDLTQDPEMMVAKASCSLQATDAVDQEVETAVSVPKVCEGEPESGARGFGERSEGAAQGGELRPVGSDARTIRAHLRHLSLDRPEIASRPRSALER